MDSQPDRSLHWQPRFAVDARLTLSALRRGPGDPAHRVEPDGAIWRTARTTTGPVSYRIRQQRLDDLMIDAWGPGAGELIANITSELGGTDRPEDFQPGHRLLQHAQRRLPGLRVPRTGRVLEVLVPAILEQRVAGLDAMASWRSLLQAYGDPPPGPAPAGMKVPPTPAQWAAIRSWDWHRCGVDARRAAAVRAGAAHAGRLERGPQTRPETYRVLYALPGTGQWTAAQVGHRALGDADALPIGDYHLAAMTGYALSGAPLSEDGVAAFYEAWRPHRYRVVRLLGRV